MKMGFKKFLSEVMAVVTLVSVIVQPVAVPLSELELEEILFEKQYQELKDVQDSFDSDEIATANDIKIIYGDKFEVEVELSGIDGVDESKIEILFHESKNVDGTDFDTHIPDNYKGVYRGKWKMDFGVARIVRQIFDLAIQGCSISQIVHVLLPGVRHQCGQFSVNLRQVPDKTKVLILYTVTKYIFRIIATIKEYKLF